MYTVIATNDLQQLVNEVNAMIAQGWKPQGGVSTNWSDSYEQAEYVQAMIMEG